MGIIEEDADEAVYWMELLVGRKIVDADQIEGLVKEANELTAIAIASIKTAQARKI